MSIGIKLTTQSSSIASFQKLLDVVAKRHQASVNHSEETSEFVICRLGVIFFGYEKTEQEITVSGDCQTNLLGAGFHKTVVELIDEIVDLNGFPFEIEDDTEYYERRDFEEMRSEHFYKWLSKVMAQCRERMGGEYKMLAVCWDYDKYMPEEVDGTVISPFGRINLQHFLEREQSEGIGAVASEFFVWNNEGRDALFYRNMALTVLWEDCYFMPSSRFDEDKQINTFIIENLEKAATMDASLPFPKEDYLLVCRLDEREPMDISALPAYECEYPIGYRKGKVTYRLGNLSFQLPGHFFYFEQEKSSGYFDNDEKDWHIVRIAAYSITEDEIKYMEDEESVRVEEHAFENGMCRLYYLGEGESDEHVYQCQAITEGQFSLFTISCEGKEEARRFSTDFIRHLVASKMDKNDRLLQQIEQWAANDEDRKIIDAILEIPVEERTAEMAELLKRAYEKLNGDATTYNPEVYDEEEMDAMEAHIDKYFGHSDKVFHEIASPDIHVDIYIVEPTLEKNYYTLITTGMGAHRMNTPEELNEYKLQRAEMLIYLPADWNIQSEKEEDYWPLRWLKILARLPIEQNTWLGWGHTVPNGGPMADNTKFTGVMLIDPENVDEEAAVCRLPNGEGVNFYQVIPLYEEEMNFKIEHGAEALLERMDDVSALVDINRRNVCAD